MAKSRPRRLSGIFAPERSKKPQVQQAPGRPRLPAPLGPVGLAGLILILALGWALVFFTVTRDKELFPLGSKTERAFAGDLAAYDSAASAEGPGELDRRLNRLEKKAKGQEERLSVLKRRRILAREDLRFIRSYRNSAATAAKDFPFSEPMAAVAAEALLETMFSGAPLTSEDSALLRASTGRLTQERFAPLVLAVFTLSGEMNSISSALSASGAAEWLSTGISRVSRLSRRTQNDLMLDALLLAILRGDTQGTPVLLGRLIGEDPQNRELLKLGADFFYDYGIPLRAAELYSRLGDDESIALEADALYLAGEIPAARNIWTALASTGRETRPADSAGVFRSFYNLAAAAENEKAAAAWLEKLFSARNPGPEQASPAIAGAASIFGIIRYTRLLDTPRSIAILDEAPLLSNPLLDLELLRRHFDVWPPDRRAAEVWLLLGRHPDDRDLLLWGAWFFDRQKLYGETSQVLKIAGRLGIDNPGIRLHQGLALIRDGKSAQAEKLFQDTFGGEGTGDWRFPANIARIQESRRSITSALRNYETAASLVADPRDAALLQLRISRCYEALGQSAESRQAMEKARALDPENITIRHELSRPLVR
jgi:tetratricopeptide (TPR) repeat protein